MTTNYRCTETHLKTPKDITTLQNIDSKWLNNITKNQSIITNSKQKSNNCKTKKQSQYRKKNSNKRNKKLKEADSCITNQTKLQTNSRQNIVTKLYKRFKDKLLKKIDRLKNESNEDLLNKIAKYTKILQELYDIKQDSKDNPYKPENIVINMTTVKQTITTPTQVPNQYQNSRFQNSRYQRYTPQKLPSQQTTIKYTPKDAMSGITTAYLNIIYMKTNEKPDMILTLNKTGHIYDDLKSYISGIADPKF